MPEERVRVTIRFLGIMQKYSDGQREFETEIPKNPLLGLEHIIEKYKIPWKDNLEKSTRIFINKEYSKNFLKKGNNLQKGDIIIFIPLSGGG